MASTTIPTGVVLPSFNNTLGALFIGSSFATMLYGVTCVQTFLYLTSRRSQSDTWLMTGFVLVLFALDTAQQCVYTAGLYGLLITDFANPFALNTAGPNSGVKLISMDEGLTGLWVIFFIQLFFCFRLWVISAPAYSKHIRIALVALALSLSLLNCGAWGANSILGSQKGNIGSIIGAGDEISNFALAWKISAASGIAFDTIITIALTSSLYRARSGIKKSNHVINLIIIATVNTNLITTLLSLAQLITFLVFPFALYYGGIALLLPKSYMNCFIATLNYRDYLQKKLDDNTATTNLVTLESMNARVGSSHSTQNTMNLRDGIEVLVETKPSDIMTV